MGLGNSFYMLKDLPASEQAVHNVSAIETRTPQVVAAQALAGAESSAADESVCWLLGDRRRLDLEDNRGRSSSPGVVGTGPEAA